MLSAGNDSEESDIELTPSALDFDIPKDVQQPPFQSDHQNTTPSFNPTILDTLSSVFADARARMTTILPLTATPSGATTSNNTQISDSPSIDDLSYRYIRMYERTCKLTYKYINTGIKGKYE